MNEFTIRVQVEQALGGVLRAVDLENTKAHVLGLLAGQHNVKAVDVTLTVTLVEPEPRR